MDEFSKRVDQKGLSKEMKRREQTSGGSNEANNDEYMPVSVSRKVMELAREQQDEVHEEAAKARALKHQEQGRRKFDVDEMDEYDMDNRDDDIDGDMAVLDHDGFVDGKTEQFYELNESEAAAFQQFMPSGTSERRTLGDIIAEKIREKEMAEAQSNKQIGNGREGGGSLSSAMNEKVRQVYTSVGTLLTRYRAGKIPKAFKVIPALRNWEEVLWITAPDTWSPQAMFVATKLFASNLKPKHAQRFYNLILLPCVRFDIRSNKKLNYHLYCAVKKALYKPAAFFKGFLLPLAENDCTLKEAMIIGSVLSKVSIPIMHSAAALLKLTHLAYTGGTSIFMTVLMNKKYSLPYKVIDAIAEHFVGFMSETRTMPVLWHQSFLVFAQRYKASLTKEQKEGLRNVLRKHQHPAITSEIRRELFNSASRKQKMVQ
jgi:essential nuclear protein 1